MSEKKTNDLTHGMRLVLWALSSNPMTTRQISGMTKQSRASVRSASRTQNSVMARNPFAQLIQHAGVTRQAARAMQEAA